MATFKEKRNLVKSKREKVKNNEGYDVFSLTALETIYSKAMGSFFGESTFYNERSADSEFKELEKLIAQVDDEDKEYILKIAVIARSRGKMISTPLNLLTICMNDERFKGVEFLDQYDRNKLRKYAEKVILRAGDITEVLSTQFNVYDRVIPKQMRLSLKDALERFNAYQLSKALNKQNSVSLADVIKLVRPNPKNANVRETFFREVIENRVKFADGEEVVQNTSKSEDPVSVIKNSSLLALLKNLLKLAREGALSDKEALEALDNKFNKDAVRKSRILPFRFYQAYKEIENNFGGRWLNSILGILSKALDYSIDNIDEIQGRTFILIDKSGSMDHKISNKSTFRASDLSCVLSAIAFKKSNSRVFLFAEDCEEVALNPHSDLMSIIEKIKSVYVGGGTYLSEALSGKVLPEAKRDKVDNLIILTDGDCYMKTDEGFTIINGGSWYSKYNKSSDELINNAIRKGEIKRVFMNNLLGNDFSSISVDDNRKNLVVGFSENYIQDLNFLIEMEGVKDIRKIIDKMFHSI